MLPSASPPFAYCEQTSAGREKRKQKEKRRILDKEDLREISEKKRKNQRNAANKKEKEKKALV